MRAIPTVTRNLLIINLLLFLLRQLLLVTPVFGGMTVDLNNVFGLYFILTPEFHIWQPLTYMFMHGGWTHVILNMFMLWMFGAVIEQVFGARKFLFYYIFCGLGAAFIQELMQFVGAVPPYSCTVGASGAIYSLLIAFGMLFPEERMFIIPIPVPIKAKWMVLGSIIIEALTGLSDDGVAHMAHLGGMLFGFLLLVYWKHRSGSYGRGTTNVFSNLQNKWTGYVRHRSEQHRRRDHKASAPAGRQSDWDYNARKKREQDEIDRILDKIRASGYDALTKEEKQKLFDQSRK